MNVLASRFILLFLILNPILGIGQFQVNGDAVQNGPDCYTLTVNSTNQSGSVWNTGQIDLTQSFVFDAEIFLGCNDGGADGIVFAFQAVNTSVGGNGGGLGYQGISPSFAVEFDTYQNGGFGDPAYDHVAIISQGSVDHNSVNNLVGPVPTLSSFANVEDCNWHDLRISWNPVSDSFQVYFDCQLRLTYVGDIVTNFFAGNPNVFWGFTAGTGALSNQQEFCYSYISYGLDTTICQGDSIPLVVGGGAAYQWSPSAGISNDTLPNPMASPDTSTQYICTITDSCGFIREELFTVTVHDTLANVYIGMDTTLCQGDSLFVDVTQSGADYLWQDNSTDSVYWIDGGGLFWVELTTGCDTLRDSVTITAETLPPINLGPDQNPCEGDTLFLNISAPNAASYLWQDGTDTAIYQITNSGLYWAEIENICGTVRDSLNVNYYPMLPKPDLGPDTLLCDLALLDLTVNVPSANVMWQSGTTGNNYTVSEEGLYWVEVSNACFSERDSIVVSYEQSPEVDLGPDTEICTGDFLQLDASWTASTQYLWQDGLTTPTYTLSDSGLYQVTLSNACGMASDEIFVGLIPVPPPIDLGRDSALCDGDQLLLSTGLSGFDFTWQDGSTDPDFMVNGQNGPYWVWVSNICGTSRDTIEIEYVAPPVLDLGADQSLCSGQTITLDVSWPGATYIWDDGSDLPTRDLTESGTYSVLVSNNCGNAFDIVNYEFIKVPKFFELGPTYELCVGETVVLDVDQGNLVTYEWQDGSTEPTYLVESPGQYQVTITNECGAKTDAVWVRYTAQPLADLGNDTVVCTDRARFIELDVRQPKIETYLWQDGSTEDHFVVNEPGIYWVTMTNHCGVDTDSILIQPTRCFCAIHVPTAFSPNGDDHNEAFRLFFDCEIVNGTFKVFNRWGEMVFEANDPSDSWDGTFNGRPVPEGVYVWHVQYEYQSADRLEPWIESGTVTLIR